MAYNASVKIVIVGAGAFGTALFSILKKNISGVELWDTQSSLIDADVLVLAVPVQAVRSVLVGQQSLKKGVIIINSAKGIEERTNLLPYHITREVCGEHVEYFALMGPSFAKEVIEEMPTLVNIGYLKKNHSEEIKKLFQTDYFRVRLVEGVEALELSGALKNVYAILCGVARGLGYGENTQAKLIALAFEEIQEMCAALDYHIDPKATPGIVGDLILTCSSVESRNYQFGKFLSSFSVSEALEKVGKTVEGYFTVSAVPHLRKQTQLSLPVASLMEKIIETNNSRTIRQYFQDFIKSV